MKKTIRTLSSMGFKAASKGDQAFAAMHPVQVVDAHDEKVSKSLEDIANAKGVIPYDRVANKHGYKKGEDEAAYDKFKYSAGGPVVAPVYTKPMHESIRSCPHCGGKACEHCGETGYAITEGEHSNAVVRALRRQQLNEGKWKNRARLGYKEYAEETEVTEGKRLKALGRALKDEGPEMMKHMAVQVGALTPAGALMGGKTMAATGAAIGAGTALYAGVKDIKRAYKYHKGTMGEDVEQIDELSKKTLGSYIANASRDAVYHGIQGSKEVYTAKGKKQEESGYKKAKKAWRRTDYIEKAADKLTKEDLDEGFASAHNALQDRIRDAITSAPSRMKSAVSGFKKKAVATYNDLEDKYQGGPQRRAMQLAQAVKAKKDQQVSRISGKASGYASKAKDLTQYAASHLDKAARLDAEARRTEIPKHNMNQVMSSDEYESRKANIQAATDQKTKLAAASKNHTEKGLSYYDSADAHAARAAKIKDRLDAALAGKSKLLGRGKPKPTAFQSRLKKTARSV